MKSKYFSVDQNNWIRLVGSKVVFIPEIWNGESVYRMKYGTTHAPCEIWEMHGILRQIDKMREDELSISDKNLSKVIERDLTAWILYLESNIIKQWTITKEENIRYEKIVERYRNKIQELQVKILMWRVLAWSAIGVALINVILAFFKFFH